MEPLLLVSLALPGPDASWETLLKSPVHVECTQTSGVPFCRSTALFEAEPATLFDTLNGMSDHVDKFESVLEVNRVADDTMHVVMDFPWPLADRDYVAKYTRNDLGDGALQLVWTPVSHDGAPESHARVRLTDFSGSWTITPKGDGKTEVVYLWHALYGGALPSGALNTARKKTGQESLKDLAGAAGGVRYASPFK